jgi:putative ABC transport system permease protein
MNLGFWLKWSWRDLRARWLQVLAIGIIIALGTGIYASMGGQKVWRKDAYDLSYGRLNMYDIHVELAGDSLVTNEELTDALSGIEGIATLETRLITPTLVDASHDDEVIMVKGELVGVDVSDGGPHVNSIYVDEDSGRNLTSADAGQNVVVVEYKFAQAHDLDPGSPIRVSGDVALDFVGAGHSPEYFMIQGEVGDFFGQENYAVLFVPLETAQKLTGHEGLVNDAVILLEEGADREVVLAEIENRMAEALPDVGISTMFTEDDPIYTLLYQDAEGDQEVWDMISILFLFGAALGAFNLAGRMVESQRREIGIGMALGVTRRWLAFRPLLVGLQIALLGTVFGLIIGTVLIDAFGSVVKSINPLPFWDIKLYMPALIGATLLGIFMPLLATLIPVWRAVRVQPVDAIKSGYLVAKGGGLSKLAHSIPLPGRSFTQMPIKNFLRSPWRSLLTVAGVTIAILLMVTIVGAMDSYVETMDRADDAYRYMAGERYLVTMNFFYPTDNGEVTSISTLTTEDGTPLFTDLEPALAVGGFASTEAVEEPIEMLVELHDMETALWVPALKEGSLTTDGPGIVISEKAAEDLGVTVGDTITLEHPQRQGLLAFRFVETEVTVAGIHDNPLRPLAYMELSNAAIMGLEDTTNLLVLNPTEGVTETDVKLALLDHPGVISVKPIGDFAKTVEQLLELITGMLAIAQVIALFLAFLIAFLSTSISVDERMREIATMFAFGLRIRTVSRMQMIENFIIGVLGTGLGIVLGWGILGALFVRAEEQTPDIGFVITVYPQTIILAAVLGVLVVTLTPIFSIRRMRRMDIPSTLRVME